MTSQIILNHILLNIFFFFGINYVINKSKFSIFIEKKIFLVFLFFNIFSFLILSILKIYSFSYHADFAIWTELINNFKNDQFFKSSIEYSFYGNEIYLGSHFVPLLFFFSLFNYVFDIHTIDIVFSNWLLLSISYLLIYKICLLLNYSKKYSLIFALSFSLYVPFQYLLISPFEMLRFIIPINFLLIYLYLKKNEYLFFLIFILAFFIREEVALYLFFFSIYIFFDKSCNFKLKLIYPLISLVSFLVIYFVLMNLFSDGSKIYTGSMSINNDTFFSIFKSIYYNIMSQISNFNLLYKLINIYYFFIPVLFLSFVKLRYLIVILPPFLIGLISDAVSHLTIFTYYQAFSYPFIYFFSILEIKNLKKNIISLKKKTLILVTSLFLTSFLYGPSIYGLQFLFNFKIYDFRTFDYSHNIYIPEFDKYLAIEKLVLRDIEKNKLVSAEQHLMPILANNGFKIKTYPDIYNADYVLIDREYLKKTGIGTVDGSWNKLRENPNYYYNMLKNDYSLLKKLNGIELFIKK